MFLRIDDRHSVSSSTSVFLNPPFLFYVIVILVIFSDSGASELLSEQADQRNRGDDQRRRNPTRPASSEVPMTSSHAPQRTQVNGGGAKNVELKTTEKMHVAPMVKLPAEVRVVHTKNGPITTLQTKSGPITSLQSSDSSQSTCPVHAINGRQNQNSSGYENVAPQMRKSSSNSSAGHFPQEYPRAGENRTSLDWTQIL